MQTRRTFLKSVSVATLSLVYENSWANSAGNSKIDVIIIGAGLSGLFAAMKLEEKGFTVRIIEANNRIGGRLYTLDELQGTPNTGGTEVGDGYKRLVAIAQKLGVELIEPKSERVAQMFVIDGKVIQQNDWADSSFNKLNDSEKKTLPHLLEFTAMQGKNPLQNLDDWYKPEFASYDIPFSEFLKKNQVSDEALRLINANANTNDIATTSALNIFKSMTIRAKGGSKKVLRIKGGSQRLPEAMAKTLKSPVITNKKVIKIEDKGNSVKVKCADGETFEAKHLIVSVPFTALQNIEIKAKIPTLHQQAIKQLPYTQITQVHFNIKKPFWEEDKLPSAIWTDGAIGRFFTEKSPYSDFTTALCWLNGNEAIQADKMTDSALAKMVLEEMKRIRPASEGAIEVAKINSWGKNPFAGGSYYHLAPNQASKFFPEILKNCGNIYFCGEHTALQNSGMEGALESAERVVGQVYSL
jgi:monoamine oxidase